MTSATRSSASVPARPGLSDRHLALVAVLAGIMWAIGAIDLNAPAPERIGLLIVGIAIGAWIVLDRGSAKRADPDPRTSMSGLLAGLYAALRARIPTIGLAALVGAGILIVPLLLARWVTQSYYVYATTVALVGPRSCRLQRPAPCCSLGPAYPSRPDNSCSRR